MLLLSRQCPVTGNKQPVDTDCQLRLSRPVADRRIHSQARADPALDGRCGLLAVSSLILTHHSHMPLHCPLLHKAFTDSSALRQEPVPLGATKCLARFSVNRVLANGGLHGQYYLSSLFMNLQLTLPKPAYSASWPTWRKHRTNWTAFLRTSRTRSFRSGSSNHSVDDIELAHVTADQIGAPMPVDPEHLLNHRTFTVERMNSIATACSPRTDSFADHRNDVVVGDDWDAEEDWQVPRKTINSLPHFSSFLTLTLSQGTRQSTSNTAQALRKSAWHRSSHRQLPSGAGDE